MLMLARKLNHYWLSFGVIAPAFLFCKFLFCDHETNTYYTHICLFVNLCIKCDGFRAISKL
jgi:hypothetical protein